MDKESINNLEHINKILSIEFNKILLERDKDIAHKDYFNNICHIKARIHNMKVIVNDTDKYIQIKKKCN